MVDLDDLIDGYLAGNSGELIDPSIGAAAAEAAGAVTLSGIADDAASGAVIVEDDGHVTLVVGLQAWPAELRGRRVEVTGNLGTTSMGDGGGLDADGNAVHGASGGSRALFDARWQASGE